jgi:hypothetical protein
MDLPIIKTGTGTENPEPFSEQNRNHLEIFRFRHPDLETHTIFIKSYSKLKMWSKIGSYNVPQCNIESCLNPFCVFLLVYDCVSYRSYKNCSTVMCLSIYYISVHILGVPFPVPTCWRRFTVCSSSSAFTFLERPAPQAGLFENK